MILAALLLLSVPHQDPGISGKLGTSQISFQWSRVGSTPYGVQIGWVFENLTDSTLTFDYQIWSMKGEKVLGRTSLAPRRRKLGGWLFSADEIGAVTIYQK